MGNNLDDLMALSNGMAQPNGNSDFHQDMLGGFADLDTSAGDQPPPAGQQLASAQGSGGGGKKTNEDLLGLF